MSIELHESSDRRSFLKSLAAAGTIAAIPILHPQLAVAAEKSNTVRDRLWLWSHVAGSYNGKYNLPGESIDVIDLMFRCEKRFGVRIELQSLMTELEFGSDGCLSQESIRYLQEKIPEIDWSARVAGIRRSNALDILTTDLICELVGAAMRSEKSHFNVT